MAEPPRLGFLEPRIVEKGDSNNILYNIDMDEVALILDELQAALGNLLGDRLVELYLYGSHARGDAKPDSDIDILVVIQGVFNHQELSCLVNSVESDLSLKYDTLTSLIFMPEHRFNNEDSPYLINIRKEAVLLP